VHVGGEKPKKEQAAWWSTGATATLSGSWSGLTVKYRIIASPLAIIRGLTDE